MSYYETDSYKLFTKFKNRRLIFIFIIANLIFGNSIFVGYIIINIAMIVAVLSASSPFDETTQLVAGFFSLIVLWIGYLWLKIYFFKYIYNRAKILGESASLYKFLNEFLYNPKVKCQVICRALVFDIVMMVIYIYIHFQTILSGNGFVTPVSIVRIILFVRVAPWYWLFEIPGIIANLLLFGGLAPSYIIFAIIGKRKSKI